MKNNEKLISCDSLNQRDKRSVIFHLLYAMESFDYDISLDSVTDNFGRGYGCIVDRGGKLFEAAQQIVDERESLDEEIKPLLDNWRFERLGVATKLILRYAIWELRYTEIDSIIVINEAIELSKSFAEKDSYRFINGILDKWCEKNGKTSSKKEPEVAVST